MCSRRLIFVLVLLRSIFIPRFSLVNLGRMMIKFEFACRLSDMWSRVWLLRFIGNGLALAMILWLYRSPTIWCLSLKLLTRLISVRWLLTARAFRLLCVTFLMVRMLLRRLRWVRVGRSWCRLSVTHRGRIRGLLSVVAGELRRLRLRSLIRVVIVMLWLWRSCVVLSILVRCFMFRRSLKVGRTVPNVPLRLSCRGVLTFWLLVLLRRLRWRRLMLLLI